jgi:hypothetical protein
MGWHSCLLAGRTFSVRMGWSPRLTGKSLCAMPLASLVAWRVLEPRVNRTVLAPLATRHCRRNCDERRVIRKNNSVAALISSLLYDIQVPAQRVIVHSLLVERGMLSQGHLPETTADLVAALTHLYRHEFSRNCE